MEITDFLVKDYELKARFLTDHFARMWTRFNYFLATETAIVSGKVIFWPAQQPQQNSLALIVLGLVVSVIWYLTSAQDRYLVDLYRQELRETFCQTLRENGFQDTPEAPLYHVGQVDKVDLKKQNIGPSIVSWRISTISTTHLAPWISLIAVLCWTGWLVKELYFPAH
jgi:hypothetical protein